MGARTGASEIVRLYRKEYPRISQRALAKILCKDRPDVFKYIEGARTMVRQVEGSQGERMRKYTKDKSLYKKLTHNTHPTQFNFNPTSAKVLVLDIETAPLLANIWGIWNQNIMLENIHSDWFMLTWAAKWLFEKKIYSARVTPKEAIDNNDKRIVESLIEMLNQADIVITHNGDKFDLPRINTRAIIHRIKPPLPYVSIDTLKVAKRSFAFTSNKLDYINKQLGIARKTETNMELWRDCFHGKEEGLKRMEKYNVNDVVIQEQTYLIMRPYIKSHPNLGLHIIDENEHCPNCGHSELTDTGKFYATAVSLFETFRCGGCGTTGRRRKALKRNKNLTQSVAR